MFGENSNTPKLIEVDREHAKEARKKYPAAFEKPTPDEVARMGKKGETEVILPDSLRCSRGNIKIKRNLVGQKIVVTPDKYGRITITKDYFDEASYLESGIGEHLLVPKNSFTS